MKGVLLLLCVVALSTVAGVEEETASRVKRQGFNFNRGRTQNNPFGGFTGFGNFGRQPTAQQQHFPINRPQVFDRNPSGGFVPVNQQNQNRPRPQTNRPARPGNNRPINCNRRRNRNRPECLAQNQNQVSSAFQQIPWLSQLSRDQQTIFIPGLPGTPTRASQNRQFLLGIGRPDEPFQQCVTPRFQQGHCRYLQHCILPEFINNFNVFLRYVCFIDSVYVGVCCPNAINTVGITQAPPTRPTPRPTERPTTPPSESRGCGLIAKRAPTRIVGGQDADPAEWPWMAALLRNGATQYCGGTLITDRHVLTAAHCVEGFDRNTIIVRLGEYIFNQQSDSSHVDFRIAEIRQHAAYDTTTYVNDIAILVLQQSTAFNRFIWPVCLPEGDEDYVGKNAVVTGWGTIYYGGPVATTLQEVTVPVWTNQECDNAYEQNIIDKQICAGARTGGKDSCQGDSGGPLLLQQGGANRWAIIGVVSWGIRCAEPGNPGVYTRVSKYRTWISQNTQ